MADNKKGKWIEKMKSDNVLKTKTQNTFIDNTIEFNSKDNALYSFVSLLLSMVCCFANQFLHFFVFIVNGTVGFIADYQVEMTAAEDSALIISDIINAVHHGLVS